MTRINLVPVEELSNQHLMAEYRELPRIPNSIKSNRAKIQNIPKKFCLGSGHVKFFYDKIGFLKIRHTAIKNELLRRGFNITCNYDGLFDGIPEHLMNEWTPSLNDVIVSRNRIKEKLKMKPDFYVWG